MIITYDIIEALQTKSGGWTKDSLDFLGVDWPPRRGWKHRMVGKKVSDHQMRLALRGEAATDRKREPKREHDDMFDFKAAVDRARSGFRNRRCV